MNPKGSLTKSGVFIYDSYKDNIIIDKYNRVFLKMRAPKLEAIRSENSEDAVTWNIFRTLQKIDPELWLPKLFQASFRKLRYDIVQDMKISLWKKFTPPAGVQNPEGPTEVDVMLENDHFVWFIEVKYKSDISMKTVHDNSRNQILRNIDIGSDYAGKKDFYFSLLILDEKYSPKGVQIIDSYKNECLEAYGNLKEISLLKFEDLRNLFRFCEEQVQYEDEKYLVQLAKKDLEKRIAQFSIFPQLKM
ncbi:hypothetical protein [Neobacillus kokaensis]|uniref:PD-(D/E)XK nuclease superfamily protein n=1 Tax=Neobacillus kokaensis TaxID=2759023 RepID=A0ABQ3MZP8_9BACI|nr:hypothetical protein [Neobacillus kokaensis]GHH96877.1 hypothetical protein AM1BK_04200 [Neobacillus kokaensis]